MKARLRMTVALSVAVVAVAGDDCPAASSADVPPRTQR